MARTHNEWFRIENGGGLPGWGFLGRLDEFAREAVGAVRLITFSAEVPGAQISATTLDELRREMEGEGEIFSLYGWWGRSAVDPLQVSFVYSMDDPRITVEGEDEARVKGTAAVLRDRVERWLEEEAKEAPAHDAAPEPAPAPAPVPWFKDPWVIGIGTVVVGGLILALITNWFGLG